MKTLRTLLAAIVVAGTALLGGHAAAVAGPDANDATLGEPDCGCNYPLNVDVHFQFALGLREGWVLHLVNRGCQDVTIDGSQKSAASQFPNFSRAVHLTIPAGGQVKLQAPYKSPCFTGAAYDCNGQVQALSCATERTTNPR